MAKAVSPQDMEMPARNGNTPISKENREQIESDIVEHHQMSSSEGETETSESTAEITETTGNDDKKLVADLETLLKKLETIRTDHASIPGKTFGDKWTCKSIRIFAIIYCAVIVFISCVTSYLFTVSDHISRRYNLTDFEMDFIHGADKITIACCLIFTSYYGNKMNKPIAIMSGALVFAFGALLFAVPYWDLGARKSYNETLIDTYLDAGLCQLGQASFANSSNSQSLTYSEQCDYLPVSFYGRENRNAYTVMCLAQLVMGVGKSFILPFGVVYIEEAEQKKHSLLYIGGVLLAHSFGTILGTVFGTWFITYPEDLQEDLSILHWEVGAWWIGFPLFACILLLISIPLLLFPKWIREPRWLLYRRYREMQREYKRQRREEEERRRRRHQKREKRRRERERKNIHGRSSGVGSAGNVNLAISNEDLDTSNGSDATNNVSSNLEDTFDDHERNSEQNSADVHVSDSEVSVAFISNSQPTDGNTGDNLDDSQESRNSNNNNDNGIGANSNEGNNRDTCSIDNSDTNDSNAQHENSHDNVNNNNDGSASSNVEEQRDNSTENAISGNDSPNTQTAENESTIERRYKPKSQRKGVRIHESARDHESENETKGQWVKDEEKEKKALQRKASRLKLGRKLKDLPQNLKYLLITPFYSLVAFGIAASFYYVSGNQSRMPVYLVDQFHYEAQEARLITGLVFGFAMFVGVLASLILLYLFNPTLERQFQVAIVLCGITCLGPIISFGLGCDTKYGKVESSEESNEYQPSCALGVCDCSVSNYYPVCSKDGVHYFSPCHAGCNRAELRNNEYVFSSCVCLGESDDVAMTYCDVTCSAGGGYVTVLFFTLVAHFMCYISFVIIILRAFAEKLRNLTVGFTMWITYVLAVVPGVAIYKYCRSTACELSSEDCDENSECWQIRESDFRNYTQTTSLMLLLTACVLFTVAFFFFRDKKKMDAKIFEEPMKGPKRGQQNVGFQKDNDSTV